jgi:hypothetical protein
MKFRKKPIVIEAVQFTGKFTPIMAFCPDAHMESGEVVIRTREGDMHASLGDWIIKGVKGEFYPCKPDIFDATYERVAPDENCITTADGGCIGGLAANKPRCMHDS